MAMELYSGVVEDRADPLHLGRCRVRIVGLHTDDKVELPTEDLPWAAPLQPITSAGVSGIGSSPVGPVEGTWVAVVFRDEYQQVPIMLGTFSAVPQSQAAKQAAADSAGTVIATDGGVLTNGSGDPVTTSDGTPIEAGSKEGMNNPPKDAEPSPKESPKNNITTPGAINSNLLGKPVPTDPPPGLAANQVAKARQNIGLLLSAMDRIGITGKYARASILAICGGESRWQPIAEGYVYSDAAYLNKIFKGVFQGDLNRAKQYCNWQGTREDFFREIYSPKYSNGRGAGNIQPDDGALFYGRGYNQLTGRTLYQSIQTGLKKDYGITVDIVNNQNSLLTDPQVCAICCIYFYIRKIPNWKTLQDDPSFIETALTRTGTDAHQDNYKTKRGYYAYFLGSKLPAADPSNKPRADTVPSYTKEDVKEETPAQKTAALEDRSSAKTKGFQDPQGKYPLRSQMNESSTNRLARGEVTGTPLEFKDVSRKRNLPMAGGGTFEQPLAGFGGVYPYAKVTETESGHMFIMDDTPTHENISLYHRAGSFIDIDANGTMVKRIVGDGYEIIDRNGLIYIGGDCNISVGRGVNLKVMAGADIDIHGETNVNIMNNANINVAGKLNLGVGDDINIYGAGNLTMQIDGEIKVASGEGTSLKSGDFIHAQAAKGIDFKAGKEFAVQTGSDVSLKSGANTNIQSAGDYNALTSGGSYTEAGGDVTQKAGGKIASDGSSQAIQSGASSPAGEAGSVADIDDIKVEIDPGEVDSNDGYSSAMPLLATPVRPSPPVMQDAKIVNQNNNKYSDFVNNPNKFYNPSASAGGVKGNYAGTPKDDNNGQSLISGQSASEFTDWFQKCLTQTAENGYWREMGQNGKPSNPNIIRIWEDLGYPKNAYWLTDQTPWCMGYVNYTLKQCGYRYVQTASAWAIRDAYTKWAATPITDFSQAQAGDIALWKYGHVNFVYANNNGRLSFIGGNQTPTAKTNNPNDGDVTLSWKSGYRPPGDGTLVGIWRPSKK
jgi:predicted chitinase